MTNSSDVERILTMFDGLGLSKTSDRLEMITVPGAPWSKSRPRFTRTGRTYTPREDQDAETRTGLYMRQSISRPYTGNVGIVCIFYRPNRQRIDTDNLIKHVCDAANGVIWEDDSQCTAVMGVIELDRENPRTVIGVGRHVSTLTRGTDATKPCAVCGKPISLEGHRGKPPKTCSQECRQASLGYLDLSEMVPCHHCGQKFRRKTKTQRFCCQQCRIDSLRGEKKRATRPFSKCADCGTELSHRRGGRCRACWRKSVAKKNA